jgi:hypothetical protein
VRHADAAVFAESARKEAAKEADDCHPKRNVDWHETYIKECCKRYIERISPIGYYELIQSPVERLRHPLPQQRSLTHD